tara:strand:+ start:198 stop:2180 length:1983 start_codon:yes stop_codon:yes gene_type:complete
MHQPNSLKYSKEIDGLRAIAVLAVVFFHAGFKYFKGGYVGVDIFFVISGYLITSIIIKDLNNNKFSLINFYERRARRILPALSFLILFCLPFVWFLMLPYQILEFASSLKFVSLFISNIYFWKAGGNGYFSTKIDEMPLLHTWSLGIEEQFYFIFPLFLIFFWKFKKILIIYILIFFFITGIFIAEWGWRNEPIANFYITPSRAWELILGSILALINSYKTFKNNLFSLFGLFILAFSIYYFDENTHYPSIISLLPLTGTCLIILYTSKNSLVYKILSFRLFVGIGLISYSLYLWHHPIFVFTKLILIEKPSYLATIMMIFLSIFLGFLSWKYVETPFRNKKNFTRNKIFIFSSFAIIIPIFIGYFLYSLGWGTLHKRTSGLGETYEHFGYFWINPIYEGVGTYHMCDNGLNVNLYCGFSKTDESKSISANNIIWGDSFAAQGTGFIQSLENKKYAQISHYSCIPLIDNNYQNKSELSYENIKKCNDFSKESIDYISENNSIKKIVISSRFEILKNMNKKEIKNFSKYFISELNNFIKSLDNRIEIKILPPPPQPNYDISSCVNKLIVNGYARNICNFNLNDLSILSHKQQFLMNEFNKNGLFIYPVNDFLCPENICSGMIGDTRVYLDDNGHIRNEAFEKLGIMIRLDSVFGNYLEQLL